MHANQRAIRRGLALGVGTAALLVVALVGGTAASYAQAPTEFGAVLSGANEVPPVETTAQGLFEASVDLTAASVTFTLSADAAGITQAHIHAGGPEENGPIVAFLFGPADPPVDGMSASGTLTAADLVGPFASDPIGFAQAVLAGGTYVNVHTLANQGGEVRGQILPAPMLIAVAPDGLPTTGSGGLAGVGGGPAPWVWALGAGGIAVAMLVGMRRTIRRR